MTLCSCTSREDRNTHNTVSHTTRDEQGHHGTIAFCVRKTLSGEVVMGCEGAMGHCRHQGAAMPGPAAAADAHPLP